MLNAKSPRFRIRKVDTHVFTVEKLLHNYIDGQETFKYSVLETAHSEGAARRRVKDFEQLDREHNRNAPRSDA